MKRLIILAVCVCAMTNLSAQTDTLKTLLGEMLEHHFFFFPTMKKDLQRDLKKARHVIEIARVLERYQLHQGTGAGIKYGNLWRKECREIQDREVLSHFMLQFEKNIYNTAFNEHFQPDRRKEWRKEVLKAGQHEINPIGETYLEALKTKGINAMKKYFPTERTLKIITQGKMEDKEKGMKKEFEWRIKKDFNTVQQIIKTKGLKIEQISFVQENVITVNPGELQAKGLSLFYTYNGIKGELGAWVIQVEGRWFLLELLKPAEAFKEIR